jgi:hypothetical protein
MVPFLLSGDSLVDSFSGGSSETELVVEVVELVTDRCIERSKEQAQIFFGCGEVHSGISAGIPGERKGGTQKGASFGASCRDFG